MLTLLHASDLHFGKPYNATAGEAFQRAAQAVAADLIVVSGDFTQRAKVAECEAARAWLDRLPDVPVVVTPGNHDVPLYRVFERLFAPYRNYRRWISDELDSVIRVAGATLVSLNSTAPLRAIVSGRIDRRQLRFAARAFRDAAPADARILVAHHHLAPAPDYEGDTALRRTPEVLDALNDMEVDLVLGGHVHRGYVASSLDVCPNTDRGRGIVIVQCGTTTSDRGRAREWARNSFNVVRITAERLDVTHYLYFEDLARFAPSSIHALPRRIGRHFLRDAFEAPTAPRTDEVAEGAGAAERAVPQDTAR
ncbi:MAG: metallophosphoesterase family protein [Gemmatimonadota bacterium]|nr:metallophosphoesterase family protein [Gemmatimonadota bacterium]